MVEVVEYGLKEPYLSQLKSIIHASRGSEIFVTLAGCYPTSVVVQGAFLSLGIGVERNVGQVFEQVLNSQEERDEIIRASKIAHRHLLPSDVPVIEPHRPANLASSILINAYLFTDKGIAVAKLLNQYDRSEHRASTIKIIPALITLANSIALIRD